MVARCAGPFVRFSTGMAEGVANYSSDSRWSGTDERCLARREPAEILRTRHRRRRYQLASNVCRLLIEPVSEHPRRCCRRWNMPCARPHFQRTMCCRIFGENEPRGHQARLRPRCLMRWSALRNTSSPSTTWPAWAWSHPRSICSRHFSRGAAKHLRALGCLRRWCFERHQEAEDRRDDERSAVGVQEVHGQFCLSPVSTICPIRTSANHPAYLFSLTARDLARFGWLYASGWGEFCQFARAVQAAMPDGGANR